MAREPQTRTKRTILLVEDERSLRELLTAFLTNSGFHLIIASHGAEALEKAKEYDGPIHLLLSDIEMPGITGIELARQLRGERPNIGIMLISGAASGPIILEDGWQFLSKPFMPDILRNMIQTCLKD
jgi:DNA-binding response OmpR family regulator